MDTDYHCFVCGWILRDRKQQLTEQLSPVKWQGLHFLLYESMVYILRSLKEEDFTWAVFPAPSCMKLWQNVWSILYSGHIFYVQFDFLWREETSGLVLQMLAASGFLYLRVSPHTSVWAKVLCHPYC